MSRAATAKLADAFNPKVKLPDEEWDALLQQGTLSKQVVTYPCVTITVTR